MRPVALGRKNWLFVASESGGKNAAVLFSLVHSCRELKVDPYRYLLDVIQQVSSPDTLMSDLPGLTPRAWAAARAVELEPVAVPA